MVLRRVLWGLQVLWANPTESVDLIKLSPGERAQQLRWEEGGSGANRSLWMLVEAQTLSKWLCSHTGRARKLLHSRATEALCA